MFQVLNAEASYTSSTHSGFSEKTWLPSKRDSHIALPRNGHCKEHPKVGAGRGMSMGQGRRHHGELDHHWLHSQKREFQSRLCHLPAGRLMWVFSLPSCWRRVTMPARWVSLVFEMRCTKERIAQYTRTGCSKWSLMGQGKGSGAGESLWWRSLLSD